MMPISFERRPSALTKIWYDVADAADNLLCRLDLIKSAQFSAISGRDTVALYAGRLSRALPQYRSHIGMTPFFPSSRNILFDVTNKMPIHDNSVDYYQSEDVFEHIEYEKLPAIFDEIFRVLKPGGLFRLSLPDYRCDIYAGRSVKDEQGRLLFDPGGGGEFSNGAVSGGGHLWFPVYESVKQLFDNSRFADQGKVDFRHYTAADGRHVLKPIDFSLGYVRRVPGNDPRVADRPRPISIVVDARRET